MYSAVTKSFLIEWLFSSNMSNLINNMENLLFQYIENHKLNIDQNIIVDEFFDLKKNNSIYFKDITKNLDFAAENFLLKVFRENPYRIIKEKLGDEALLWFYLKEIETKKSSNTESWFVPPESSSYLEQEIKKLEFELKNTKYSNSNLISKSIICAKALKNKIIFSDICDIYEFITEINNGVLKKINLEALLQENAVDNEGNSISLKPKRLSKYSLIPLNTRESFFAGEEKIWNRKDIIKGKKIQEFTN